jgi:hypothetical protein
LFIGIFESWGAARAVPQAIYGGEAQEGVNVGVRGVKFPSRDERLTSSLMRS